MVVLTSAQPGIRTPSFPRVNPRPCLSPWPRGEARLCFVPRRSSHREMKACDSIPQRDCRRISRRSPSAARLHSRPSGSDFFQTTRRSRFAGPERKSTGMIRMTDSGRIPVSRRRHGDSAAVGARASRPHSGMAGGTPALPVTGGVSSFCLRPPSHHTTATRRFRATAAP